MADAVREYLRLSLSALSYLSTPVVTIALWWAVRRSAVSRPFWRLLALGWTSNLVGNLAWMVYEYGAGQALPPLSLVDGFYLGRYLLIGLAFWSFPNRQSWRLGLELAAVLLVAAAATWVGGVQSVFASPGRLEPGLVGLAMYPILDAGLIYMALRRWQLTLETRLKQTVLVLAGAMVAYGLANCINWGGYTTQVAAESILPTLFWLFSDLLTGAAVVSFFRRNKQSN